MRRGIQCVLEGVLREGDIQSSPHLLTCISPHISVLSLSFRRIIIIIPLLLVVAILVLLVIVVIDRVSFLVTLCHCWLFFSP